MFIKCTRCQIWFGQSVNMITTTIYISLCGGKLSVQLRSVLSASSQETKHCVIFFQFHLPREKKIGPVLIRTQPGAAQSVGTEHTAGIKRKCRRHTNSSDKACDTQHGEKPWICGERRTRWDAHEWDVKSVQMLTQEFLIWRFYDVLTDLRILESLDH